MSTDKQYWLFAGHQYYPKGGMHDFMFVGTIDECKQYFADHADEIAKAGSSYIDNWGQIVDMETRQIVLDDRHYSSEIEWEAYDPSSY